MRFHYFISLIEFEELRQLFTDIFTDYMEHKILGLTEQRGRAAPWGSQTLEVELHHGAH